MRIDIFAEMFSVKYALLFTKSFKRQKYIDELEDTIKNYIEEIEEDLIDSEKGLLGKFKKEIKTTPDSVFNKSFFWHRILRFGKNRLFVDAQQPKTSQSFKKYNNLIKLAFMAMDYDRNLEWIDDLKSDY